MIELANPETTNFKTLSPKEKEIMDIIRFTDRERVLPSDRRRGGFIMSFGRLQYRFMFKVSGWRILNERDNKMETLDVPNNKWVDYQLETMFRGW